MPIVFRCNNVAGFDNESESYVVCNQKLKVKSERAGARIKCPKCDQELEVPTGNDGPEAFAAIPASMPDDAGANLQAEPNVMDMKFSDKGSKSTFSKTSGRCSQCGGRYDDKFVCGSCGYVEPVQQASRRAAKDEPPRLAGFQLWISTITNDGASIKMIGYVMVALVTLFCLLTMVWGLLSTSFPGIVCAVLAAFLLMFTFMVVVKTRQLAYERYATMGVLGPIWNLLLVLARMFEWEKYDGKLRNRKVVDLRKTPVTDGELSERSDLGSCQVLDLENSSVTDASLNALYRLKHLQCLVVKNTEVTPEELFKLQQHKPHLWIWS